MRSGDNSHKYCSGRKCHLIQCNYAKTNTKKRVFLQLAVIGKSLSNANRLEILEFLAQGERSVDELSKVAGLSVANTSQHLQGLRHSGLVKNRSEGKKVYYRLSDYTVIQMFGLMRAIAETNIAEFQMLIKNYLLSKDSFEPVKRDELLQRVNSGEVMVIDVRPDIEFD